MNGDVHEAINRKARRAIINRATERLRELGKPEFLRRHGGCLYWTVAMVQTLRQHDFDARLAAGTMYLTINEPEELRRLGDEETPYNFGYEWDPGDPMSRMALSMGCLPEMHVWTVLGSGEIIDPAVPLIPSYLLDKGIRVTAITPRDCIWTATPEEQGVRYTEHPDATAFAHKAINHLFSLRL